MTEFRAVLLLLILFTSAGGYQTYKSRTKPNILFILADDMGYNDVGYNNPKVKTPNLDKLAREGLILDKAYSLPLCTPSRAALLTGKYPFKIGMQHLVLVAGNDKPMPVNIPTLPEQLKQAGYSTHLVGKWNLGDCSKEGLPQKRGFDTFRGFLTAQVDHFTRESDYGFNGETIYEFFNGTDIFKFPNTVYMEDFLKDRAKSLIQRAAAERQKPFFLMYSTHLPHAPIQVPQKFKDLYDSNIEDTRRTYLGMLSALDASVGELVDELDRQGLRDDTVIIFMSDNGGMANTFPLPLNHGFYGNNYPLRSSKGSLFEGGVRVPTFINNFRLQRSSLTKELFHITDWMPTILSWAGAGTGGLELDGVDQTGMLKRYGGRSARKELVVNILDNKIFVPPTFSNSSAAIIRNGWKLITGVAVTDEDFDPNLLKDDQWSQPDEWRVSPIINKPKITGTSCGNRGSTRPYCLFNLRVDPNETVDVADKFPHVANWLLRRLEWYKTQVVTPVNTLPPYSFSISNVTDSEGNLAPGYCDPLTN